ncbi:MAG: hypothetical protein ABI333_12985 [bacterium]
MKIATLLSFLAVAAWSVPALAAPKDDTSALTACGDKDGKTGKKKKRKGDTTSITERCHCGDKDGKTGKKKKRKGNGQS